MSTDRPPSAPPSPIDATSTGSSSEPGREAALVTERMLRTMPSIVYVFDVRERRTLFVSPNIEELLGYSPADVDAENGGFLERLLHADDAAQLDDLVRGWRRAADGEVLTSEYRIRDSAGRWRWLLGRHSVFSRTPGGEVLRIIGTAIDIGDRRAAESALRDREARLVRLNRVLRTLGDVNRVVLRETEPARLLSQVCEILAREPVYALVWAALTEEDERHAALAASSVPVEASRFRIDLDPDEARPGFAARAILERRVVRIDEHSLPAEAAATQRAVGQPSIRTTLALPLVRGDHCLGVLVVHAQEADVVDQEETALLAELAANLGYALAHLEAEEERRLRTEELALLNELTRIALEAESLDALAAGLVERLADRLEASCCCLALWNPTLRRLEASSVAGRGACAEHIPDRLEELTRTVVDDGAAVVRLDSHAVDCPQCGVLIGLPVRSGEQVLGVLVVSLQPDRTWTLAETARAEQAASQVALAVAKARLVESNRRRVAALLALHETGVDLGAELDVEPLLQAIVDRAERLVEAPMGGLYLLEASGLRMVVADGSLEPFLGSLLPAGQGVSGRVVETLEPLLVNDYRRWDSPAALFGELEIGSVIAAPIQWRGEVLGVLHVEHPEPERFGPDEVELVTLFAEQAAVAIANSRLFHDLERARREVEQAYDATLEGWVRALDLRDKETEGHTQRVIRMTLTLARRMGIPDHQLVHVRRGVLLHDLGKIGIPDHILLKRGPHDPEETTIMRRHPELAYEMLSPIAYLAPALDIPYCHHERWDGNGYPRGLAGEQIPLSARVFTVVDVWDALSFDRPYRKAWPACAVREYIAAGAGTQFDPRVVAEFLHLIDQE